MKIKLTMHLALCCLSLIMVGSVQAVSMVSRPFTGTYTWWGALSSGTTTLHGTVDFTLKDYGPEYGTNPWVGILGMTYDGKLSFEDDFYEPGENTIVTEKYSTINSCLVRNGGHIGGDGPRPDIFEDNSPIILSILPLYMVFGSQVQIEAELKIYAAPSPVPEPTSMLLFGVGLAGLVGKRLRRKKYLA